MKGNQPDSGSAAGMIPYQPRIRLNTRLAINYLFFSCLQNIQIRILEIIKKKQKGVNV